MHKLPVTFVLDRAGITGPDGPSHYGIWDMSVFGVVPGPADRRARATPPRCARSCARRSPSTTARRSCASRPARSPPTCRRVRRVGPVDVLAESARTDVLLVARRRLRPARRGGRRPARRAGLRGHRGRPALGPPGAGRAGRAGRASTGSWSPSRTASATGGVGDALAKALRDADVRVPLRDLGVPADWHPHGTRARDPRRPGADRAGRGPRRHRLDLRPGRRPRTSLTPTNDPSPELRSTTPTAGAPGGAARRRPSASRRLRGRSWVAVPGKRANHCLVRRHDSHDRSGGGWGQRAADGAVVGLVGGGQAEGLLCGRLRGRPPGRGGPPAGGCRAARRGSCPGWPARLSTTSGWPGTGSWYVCSGLDRSAGETTGAPPSAGR